MWLLFQLHLLNLMQMVFCGLLSWKHTGSGIREVQSGSHKRTWYKMLQEPQKRKWYLREEDDWFWSAEPQLLLGPARKTTGWQRMVL